MSFATAARRAYAPVQHGLDTWFALDGDRAIAILLVGFVVVWTAFQAISFSTVDLHVDMTEVYSSRLRVIAAEEAAALAVALTEGVYACMPGPSYETPAEIRMLRTLGADVVGMSTVPEAIVARHGGMEVLGIALVSNAAAGVLGTPITHEEVLEAGRNAAPVLAALIERIVARIAEGRASAR